MFPDDNIMFRYQFLCATSYFAAENKGLYRKLHISPMDDTDDVAKLDLPGSIIWGPYVIEWSPGSELPASMINSIVIGY